MILSITEEHFLDLPEEERSATNCPVALALEEALKADNRHDVRRFEVTPDYIYIYYEGRALPKMFFMHYRLRRMVEDYYLGFKLYPFEDELPI